MLRSWQRLHKYAAVSDGDDDLLVRLTLPLQLLPDLRREIVADGSQLAVSLRLAFDLFVLLHERKASFGLVAYLLDGANI